MTKTFTLEQMMKDAQICNKRMRKNLGLSFMGQSVEKRRKVVAMMMDEGVPQNEIAERLARSQSLIAKDMAEIRKARNNGN